MEKSLGSMPFCSRHQHSFSRPQKQRTGEQHETANVKSQLKLSNCVRLFWNALKGGACGWSLDSGECQSSAIERHISTIFDKRRLGRRSDCGASESFGVVFFLVFSTPRLPSTPPLKLLHFTLHQSEKPQLLSF